MLGRKHDDAASMLLPSTQKAVGITRRQVVKAVGDALAGAASLAALSSLAGGELSNATEALRPQTTQENQAGHHANPGEKLRIATCQFPVSGNTAENAKYIRAHMRAAAGKGAHLLHTSEASLSGYAGCDFKAFDCLSELAHDCSTCTAIGALGSYGSR